MASDAIRDLQKALGVPADGVRGPVTNAAILRAADMGRLSARPAPPPVVITAPESFEHIPEAGRARLQGVHPVLQSIILQASALCDVPFTCIEGIRTIERQRELVARGASKTMASRHLTGHAVDLWPLDPKTGQPLPSDAAYPRGSADARKAGARLWSDLRVIAHVVKGLASARGVVIEWGGDWGWDAPHFQLSRDDYPA